MTCTVTGRSQQTELNNFESALIYLTANKKQLAAKWVNTRFEKKQDLEKTNELLKSGLNFKVPDTFHIRGIRMFKDTIAYYKDYIKVFNGSTIPDNYSNLEYFEAYSDSASAHMINKLGLNINSDFIIGFSKPRKDYLVCEIWSSTYGKGYKTRFGEALMVLFLFNDDSSVKKVYFKRIIK